MNIRSELDQRGRGSQKGHAGEGGGGGGAAESPVPWGGLPLLVGTWHRFALAPERRLPVNRGARLKGSLGWALLCDESKSTSLSGIFLRKQPFLAKM